MAKETKKQEVAVIDFEKFSVAQLPELQGKKEEIKGIIEANPIVDIIDNSTHEFANYKEEVKYIEQVETKSEVTWKSIMKEWNLVSDKYPYAFDWLSENYHAPTKKQ